MSEKIYTIGLYEQMEGGAARFLCEDGERLTYDEAEKGTGRRNKACPHIKPLDPDWWSFEVPIGRQFYMFAAAGEHATID